MTAPAPLRPTRTRHRGNTPPAVLRRAAHILRASDTAGFDILWPLVCALLAAAETYTPRNDSAARLSTTAMRARLVDLAGRVVDEHERAERRGHLIAVPDVTP